MVKAKVFPSGSAVKNLTAVQETQVQSLGREDPLEVGMITHSSILARKIPWTEEPGGLHTVHEVAKSWTRLILNTHALGTVPGT